MSNVRAAVLLLSAFALACSGPGPGGGAQVNVGGSSGTATSAGGSSAAGSVGSAGGSSSGGVSSSATAAPGSSRGNLVVTLTSPNGTHFTRAEVFVQVAVTGGTPDRVELLSNGELLVTLEAPYTYAWDTRATTEGNYALSARAWAGATSVRSADVLVVVDRTPPRVTARAPAPGDTQARVDTRIQVTFNEALDPAGVWEGAVTFTDGSGVPLDKDVALSANGRALEITPREATHAPASRRVELSAALRDLAGNPLAQPGIAWAWSYPVWAELGHFDLDAGDSLVHENRVLAALDRDLIVGMRGRAGTDTGVHLSRFDGTTWTDLPRLDGLGHSSHQVLGCPDGSLRVLADADGLEIVLVTLGAGAWTEAPRIAARTGAVIKHLAGACRDGGVLVAWSEGSASMAYEVHVQRYAGGQWSGLGAAQDLGTLDQAAEVAVSFDVEGRPLVFWYQNDGLYDVAQGRVFEINTWRLHGTTQDLPDVADLIIGRAPFLLGTSGQAPFWGAQLRRDVGGSWRVYNAVLEEVAQPDGGHLLRKLDYTDDGFRYAADPAGSQRAAFALTPAGRPVLAFHESTAAGDTHVLHHDGAWRHLPPLSGAASNVAVAVTSDGHFVVARQEGTGTLRVFQYNP